MGFLDNLSKTISHGVDRAKFEADKFQKTTRLQNEINELKRQIDANRMEFGDRAIQLFRVGQIKSATLGEILKAMDALQGSITLKEEELKASQTEVFVEPTPAAGMEQRRCGSPGMAGTLLRSTSRRVRSRMLGRRRKRSDQRSPSA